MSIFGEAMEEVKKRNWDKKIADGKFFVFGYGSLMHIGPRGLNGRGTRKLYLQEDLLIATLNDFRRGLFACFSGHSRYYGILPSKGDKVLGTLIPIDEPRDFGALMVSEGALHKDRYEAIRKNYDIEYLPYFYDDVANKVDGCPNGAVVIAVVCPEDRSHLGQVDKGYVCRVWNGIQALGSEFVKGFRATGGARPLDKTMAIYKSKFGSFDDFTTKRLMKAQDQERKRRQREAGK